MIPSTALFVSFFVRRGKSILVHFLGEFKWERPKEFWGSSRLLGRFRKRLRGPRRHLRWFGRLRLCRLRPRGRCPCRRCLGRLHLRRIHPGRCRPCRLMVVCEERWCHLYIILYNGLLFQLIVNSSMLGCRNIYKLKNIFQNFNLELELIRTELPLLSMACDASRASGTAL